MKGPLYLVALTMLATLLPSGAALTAPPCSSVTDPAQMTPAGFYYATGPTSSSGVGVWWETNGVAGLQKADCTDASGQFAHKDTYDRLRLDPGCPLNGVCFL